MKDMLYVAILHSFSLPKQSIYIYCMYVPDTVIHLCLCVLQDVLNGEEGLSEEEKARRKAERRKAKRKVRGN